MSNSISPPKAVILAGGPGTRLQPLTYEKPKSMMPLLNKPFMEHTLAYLNQFGIEDIILTLNYLPGAVRNYFGDGSRIGVRLVYCVENSPMGTAGAVKNSENFLNGTFIVINGDVFTNLDIVEMLAFHLARGAMATISLAREDNPGAFGVVETDDAARVRQFIEKPGPGEAPTSRVNTGTYILEPEVLKYIPPNSHFMFEKGLFPHLIKAGEPVYGYPFNGYWLDMGTPARYLSLNCDLLSSKVNSALIKTLDIAGISCGQGVNIHPSANISGPVLIGDNCRIDREVHIKGPAVLGPECLLEYGASIENTVLWRNARIGAGARLRQCIIGSDVRIEPNNRFTDCVVTCSHTVPI